MTEGPVRIQTIMDEPRVVTVWPCPRFVDTGYAAFKSPRSGVSIAVRRPRGLIWPIEACRRRRLYRSSIHLPTSIRAAFFVGHTRR